MPWGKLHVGSWPRDVGLSPSWQGARRDSGVKKMKPSLKRERIRSAKTSQTKYLASKVELQVSANCKFFSSFSFYDICLFLINMNKNSFVKSHQNYVIDLILTS